VRRSFHTDLVTLRLGRRLGAARSGRFALGRLSSFARGTLGRFFRRPLAASFFAFLETTASPAAAPASAPLARATAIFFRRTALRGFCAWRGFACGGLAPFISLRLFSRRYEFIGLKRALVTLGRLVRPWRFNHPASGNNLVQSIDILFFFKQKIRNVEEGITFQTNIDEGRLHARQHARDPAFVDGPRERVFVFAFVIAFS